MKTIRSTYRVGRRFRMAPPALLILVLVLWALPANAQAPAEEIPAGPPSASPGTISGVVRPPFGETFRGASITLTEASTGKTLKTTTDTEGKYEFKNLGEASEFSVYVEPDGFAPTYRPAVAPGNFADFQVRTLMLWEPLSPLFTWSYNSRVGERIRQSTWAFAYIEVFHLLGLTVLLGSVVALSLRLANIAMKSLPPAEVAKEIRPYMICGLLLTFLSGLMLFAAEAEKLFLSYPFQWKIIFFAVANIFQFTAVFWIARTREGSSLLLGKLAAILAVVFWYVVAWEGRAIAFF